MFGEPRATNDVDLAVRISPGDLDPVLARLHAREFYVPERLANDAIANRTSFNVIHPSGLKVDLFVHGDGLLDRLQMERRVRVSVATEPPSDLWVTSPDDQILRKLDWYRLGQQVSDRQWRDIIGLLQAQATHVDLDGLRSTAADVGLDDLLGLAMEAAGIRS